MLARQVGLPVVAGVIFITLISAFVGLLITHVLDGSVGHLDLHVTRTVVAHRTAALDRLTAAATVPADTIAVAVLSVAAVAVAAWWTRALVLPAFFVAAVGGEKLTYLLTTELVRRPRPPVPPLGHVFATSSFPSGHVGSVITLYGGIVLAVLSCDAVRHGRQRPRPARLALGAVVAGIAVLVAFSRVYRGHHYLTDVVWGAVVGATWLAFAWHLTRPGQELEGDSPNLGSSARDGYRPAYSGR